MPNIPQAKGPMFPCDMAAPAVNIDPVGTVIPQETHHFCVQHAQWEAPTVHTLPAVSKCKGLVRPELLQGKALYCRVSFVVLRSALNSLKISPGRPGMVAHDTAAVCLLRGRLRLKALN